MDNPVTLSGIATAADDLGGYFAQRIKIITGADGVNGGDVTPANPLPVSIQNASIAVTTAAPTAATVAEFTVAAATTSATLRPANANRKGLAVRNTSTGSAYVSFSGTATTSSPIEIPSGGYWELPALATGATYQGVLSVISAAANGLVAGIEFS